MKDQLLGEFWHECARSGFMYPESQMTKTEKGLWIANDFLDPEDLEESTSDNQ